MSTNSFTGSVARPTNEQQVVAQAQPLSWRRDALSVALIVAWIVAALFVVYRTPQPLTIDLGSTYARAYLKGFHAPERNEQFNYAFTSDQSQIWVPGAGSALFATDLYINAFRPQHAEPARMTLSAGPAAVTIEPATTIRGYHLLLPATRGDLDLRIVSNTFRANETDPRPLGIPIDRLTATATSSLPPLRASALILALAVGLYALARRLAVRSDISTVLTLVFVSLGLIGLYNAPLLITVGLVKWLVVVSLIHLALWPLQRFVRWIYKRINLPLSNAEETWLWRIFAAATLVKLGGILYPHAIIFDQAAHVLRMNWVLDGRFMELYRPGYTSFMGNTVGLASGQFPYSPLWYLIVVPFRFLGLGFPDATNGLSALMDVSKMFPIHIIALATTRSRRTAVMAAGLYQLIPMPYFLLSWGNYPTQFGLWALLLATAFLVIVYDRIPTRRTFWIWVGLMALAILSYTVLGVFAVTLFGLLGLLGLLQRRNESTPLNRKRLQFIVVGMIVAELFCFAIYHAQFAQSLLMDTLPAVVAGTTDRIDNPLDAQAEARDNALANFKANNQFTVNRFTPLMLILTAIGGFMVARHDSARRWWPLWWAWLLLFVLYTLVSAYVADMVLKHVFVMMPLVCIWTAVVLNWAWQRRWIGQLAALSVLGYLAWEVVQDGYIYVLVKRHFT